MRISKHGKITITKDAIEVTGFSFDFDCDDTVLSAQEMAIKWGIKELKESLK